MKAALKWTLAGLGALLTLLLLLAVGAWLLLPKLYDADDYKRWISEAVEARTGRALEIDALRITGGGFSITPRIELESIRYPNAPWGTRTNAIEIDRATLSLDLQQLVRGRLLVDDIVLHRPQLWIERNADGVHNLALPKRESEPRAARATALWFLELSRLGLRDGAITVNTPRRQWDIRIADANAISATRGAPVTITVRGAIEQVPVTATATAASAADLLARKPSSLAIDAQLGDARNRIRADGNAHDLLRWRGVDLQLDFDLQQMPALASLFTVQLPRMASAPVRGSARLHQPTSFRSMQLQAIDLRAQAHGMDTALRGDIARLTRLSGLDLTYTADGAPDFALPNWIARHGEFDAHLRAQLTGAVRDLRIAVQQAEARNDAMQLRAQGTLAYADRAWRSALPVEIELPSVDKLIAAQFGASASSDALTLGAARGSADLIRMRSAWRIANLQLALVRDGLQLNLHGAINDLAAASKSPNGKLRVEFDADDARYLQAWIDHELPPLSDLRLRGDIMFDDGVSNARVDELAAQVYGVAASARGTIRDITGDMRVDLAVAAPRLKLERAHLPDAWKASPFADSLLALMPLRASARVVSDGVANSNLQWRIEDIEAKSLLTLTNAEIAGAFSAFAPLSAQFAITADGPATTLLPKSWSQLRKSDANLKLSFDAMIERGATAIANLDATWTAPDARIKVTGDIGQLRPLDRAELAIGFNAARVADLVATVALNSDNSVEGNATLDLQARQRHAQIAIQIGDSDLDGMLSWHAAAAGDPNAVPWIEGDLRADRLDLANLFVKAAKKTRFFSADKLNLDWIGARDGRITLAADEFRNRQLRINDARMQLDLRDGALRQVIAGRVGRGELTMDLSFDSTAAPPRMSFAMTGAGLATTGLVALREKNYLEGGTFGAEIDFHASGNSVAEFAASADGRAALRLDDVQIKNDSIDAVGGDIFSNLVTAINPFRSIGEYVNVECAWLRFDIADGVAASADALGMKTDKVTVFGGGQVDFSDESMRIVLLPKARKGFGINPSSLVKMVQLGGTLAEPRIEAGGDPAQLLQTGVAVWAGLATGGLSLLAKGLFDRAHANADLCAAAEAAPPPAEDDAPETDTR